MFLDSANHDFHLQVNSPCIDKGSNLAQGLQDKDFEMDPRIFDGDNDGTAMVDIGADEYVTIVSSCECDFEPDGDVDGFDLVFYLLNATGISLTDFAVEFGRTDCLQ